MEEYIKHRMVDKIMDQIHQMVNTHDLTGLKELWSVLDSRIFCRLEQCYAAAVKKLETSLFKLYVINCIQSNRVGKMQEFFDKTAAEIQSQHEWREWFVLPYCKCAEEDKAFSMYFTKQWQDTLFLSLHNFLSVVMQTMPAPKPFNQDAEIKKINKLMDENAKLKQQLRELSEKKELPLTQTSSRASLSDSILSPTGALAGPSAMDLMDDFYIISQDTIIEDTPKVKSQPLKSFLSSIGRSSPGTTRKQFDEKKITTSPGRNGTTSSGRNSKAVSVSVSKKQENTPCARTISEPAKAATVRPKAAESRAERPKSVDVPSISSSHSPVRLQEKKARVLTAPEFKQGTVAREVTIENSHKTSALRQPDSSQRSKTLPQPDSNQRNRTSSQSDSNHRSRTLPQLDSSRTIDKMCTEASSGDVKSSVNQCGIEVEPVATGRCPFSLLSQEEYGEHQSSVTHCKFSGSAHSVATLDVDGVVKVWGLQPSAVTVATVMSKSMLQSLEWVGKSDNWLLLGSKAGSVRLFDVNKKQIEKEASVDSTYTRVAAMCCNPDGSHFVCSASGRQKANTAEPLGRFGNLTLWNIERMQIQKSLVLKPGPVAVNCMCYNHTGRLILTGAADGIVRLYEGEIQTSECVMQWRAHEGEVYTVTFSADSNTCYTMGGDGKFVEWSLAKNVQKLRDLSIHNGACGPFILSGAAGYRQVQTPKGKLFAFDANQRHAITCGTNGGCIYNIAESNGHAECVMLLGGHKTPVVSVDWSTATETMMCLSASMDGKVRVSTLLAH